MNKNTRFTNILLAILSLVLLIISTVQHWEIGELKDIINKSDTTTTIKVDTVYNTQVVTDTVPKLKYKYITKRDTLYKDSIQHIVTLENKTYEDTLITKDDTISYQAHISGYNMDDDTYPRLDSINLHRAFKTVTVYQETIIEKKVPQKQNKVYLAPQFTVGYDVFNKQWGGTIGVGIGVRLGK